MTSIFNKRISFQVQHDPGNLANTEKIPFEEYSVSAIQFAKHMAFAGYTIEHPRKYPFYYFRFLSSVFETLSYWDDAQRKFVLPAPINNDPTERNYLSNRLGKAFADILAKEIYKANYTHNYEDLMVLKGIKVKGSRPDFYCDTGKQQFSIEAKGFSQFSVSNKQMQKHKKQAKSPHAAIPVNYWVASVAYSLYNSPKVKFFDPEDGAVRYDKYLNLFLQKQYYQKIERFLGMYTYKQGTYEGYTAYYIKRELLMMSELNYDLAILVHPSIPRRTWEQKESLRSEVESPRFFVDKDGIGLALL